MSDLIIFWHRRDLRLSDHVGLTAARKASSQIIGVFCLDPMILHREDIAASRVSYLIDCLQALQESYLNAGSQLLIFSGSPAKVIPNLAKTLQAQAVFWHQDVEPYAKSRDVDVAQALKEQGIRVETFWDQLLHSPAEIYTGNEKPYTVYTPFWKNWITKPKSESLSQIANLTGLSVAEQEIATQAGAIALPSAKDLGFVWDGAWLLPAGESAAIDQLEAFSSSAIFDYQEQRNFPAIDGTSRLSPALKFGTIGIRTVWAATLTAFEQTRSEESQKAIQTWQQELAWREFYQHALYHFPELANGPYRQQFNNFHWDENYDRFEAWCAGETGYPIVDAAMRQLNEIGWMHNRCRMIVASFLTKDLLINWQWGEKYFMQRLVDGDLASNNGGWQWSTSSGMDPKPLRIFNPITQSQKFDPEGEYIRQWVSELRSVDSEDLVTGKISPIERQSLGYPQPIVDHNLQQKEFKRRYQLCKGD
ncbi:cryptochrome/photolyase family protein [Merismopedia glauca]|uniref:Deoxyribodipyrimidine photolyase n=1 Tax=Merismopedia glauca CCAP 1448/3 TaxID=1296344 RepID=A0A2T1C6Z8_9CYAN|nr:deoxyribodipyrimidine photo-lyase [Merismopedia glauca]PSB03923.1 deoxyribodipyrimidine photolyase [Merismopedia glauca CCAP 1448/3]